jgi:acyl-CoA reductase-like NAD-dependent aldehyde dehydrogenase
MSPVVSPYSREIVDTVPEATSEQVDQALAAAERATATMGQLTGYEHSQILNRGC